MNNLSLVQRPLMQDLLRAQLVAVANGASTKRYHTVRTIQPDTVGHHSFIVAWLCWLLTDGTASRSLLVAAMAHDLAEQWTGDLPAPAKRAMGIREKYAEIEDASLHTLKLPTSDLDANDTRVLKLADAMAGMLFCVTEAELGSIGIRDVYSNFWSYASEVIADDETEASVFHTIDAMWRNRRIA